MAAGQPSVAHRWQSAGLSLQLKYLVVSQGRLRVDKDKMSDITFTMIKPDAVAEGNIGAILQMIEQAGFRIKAAKLTKLSAEAAGTFYEVHKERGFYADLCKYMSSGPILAAVLQKEDAVASFRKLIGATNPANAEEGTIRKRFARSIEANAVHGSDSDANALQEAAFYFSTQELVN